MEAEAVRGPKKKKLKGKKKDESATANPSSKPKAQQVRPNPDEVIEIERPGSSVSQRSNPVLFAANPAPSETSEVIPPPAPTSGRPSSANRPGTAALRTASPAGFLPFRSSQVTPVNGSLASLRSREAWSGADPKEYSTERAAPRLENPVVAATSAEDNAVDEVDGEDSKSIRSVMSAPKMKGEEQAYVPYLFARDTVVRIANDMHKMKDNHVNVINQIELNYRLIEDETQRQFNSFVLNLRGVYRDKLTIFQHVIDIHRKDTDQKKDHWDSNLTSLSKQNRKLLGDKKALLIQNKLLMDRMGIVREEATRDLIIQLDTLNLNLSTETKSHSDDVEKWEEERSELEKEIERLRSREPEIVAMAVPTMTSTVDREGSQAEPEIITKEVIVDMSETERAELKAERQRMTDEMAAITLQRQQLENEREESVENRKKHVEEKGQLQEKITDLEKASAEWKGKYDITKVELTRFGSLRNDYDLLLVAYNAMAVAASNVGQADEKIEKCKTDKTALEDDKIGLEKDIEKWEKEFKDRTGKEPTEDDQPDSIKEFKVMLKETDNAIGRLDVEVVTMEKLRSGEAPPPPALSAEGDKAASVAEPIVKIVEVKVPDPDALVKLQAAEEKNDKLQKENANLQTKVTDLQAEISDLKSKISDLEARLKKSTAENSSNMKTILKLTNQLRNDSKALKAAQAASAVSEKIDQPDAVAPEEGEEVKAAVVVGAADHTDCERTIKDLQATIQRLESRVEDSEAGDDDSEKIEALQEQLDALEEKLRKEEAEHNESKEEIEDLKNKIKELEEQLSADKSTQDELSTAATADLAAQLAKKEKELKASQTRVTDLEGKLLANVPVDTAAEMKKLMKKIASLTKDNDVQTKKVTELSGKAQALEAEKKSTQTSLDKEKTANTTAQAKLKAAKEEKEAELGKLSAQWDKKEKARVADNKAKVEALNKKIKELESRPAAPRARPGTASGDGKAQKQVAVLTEQLQDKKKDNKELQAKIAQLQEDVKKAKAEGGADLKEQKKQEKVLKELSKKLDMETKKAERDGAKVKELEAEVTTLTKDRDSKEAEVKSLKGDIEQLGVTAAQALEFGEQVKTLQEEVKHLNKETARLTEAYNTERVQRKKYFNMVEDMKGKIRVYCRARPMSKPELGRGNFSVLKAPDEYSISVESTRGLKEFNFDRIFMPENSQEQVFEDTYHLIQSAVDGFNVCIFAYGQTGSGKTYTMIGTGDKKSPGIAPRAFTRIFEVIAENKEKFDFNVTSYMLELYNDKLLDLYSKDGGHDDKMDIKKDKAGLVFVKGAVIKDANTEEALNALFDEGSKNRHTAATKMNDESSRSHLILSVVIESTNKTNGQVTRGKLSLVDLAGSERVGKTGATAETLKEANSINKSLAALGDVISSLSSSQDFIPYRNNKLTMLMQDSLGGNAKTLMFVNISPADYNADETITSLTYASRVKLITNDAQKNTDNKEIARLKAVISKLKTGETIDEDDA